MESVDEFLALQMPPAAKLVALFLATRPSREFTFREVADAIFIHPAEVEMAALFLLRHDATPFHPIVVGLPAQFTLAADHKLRGAFEQDDPAELGEGEAAGEGEGEAAQKPKKARAKGGK